MLKVALAITSGLTIMVAVLGGAMAQSRAASVTLEGIARNPEAASKVMTPMIIALALIESLVIYALVIAFLLQGKI
ncbi:MAG: ATP synthase F0 subunit C [Proteobacteria bacterium]|nr:ATP synthase F0 subunit C [Pseudomonadota bacterium]